MKPVVLIGIAGAGKSTSGKIVAEKLGFEFVDTDLIIEKAYGKDLDEVVKELGAEVFSQKEGEIFMKALQPRRVLAPGGSIIYHQEAMEKARSEGFIVFIELDFSTWFERIGGRKPRGFLLLKGKNLKEEYEARYPLYLKYAHVTVNGNLTPEQVADKVVREYTRKVLKSQ